MCTVHALCSEWFSPNHIIMCNSSFKFYSYILIGMRNIGFDAEWPDCRRNACISQCVRGLPVHVIRSAYHAQQSVSCSDCLQQQVCDLRPYMISIVVGISSGNVYPQRPAGTSLISHPVTLLITNPPDIPPYSAVSGRGFSWSHQEKNGSEES